MISEPVQTTSPAQAVPHPVEGCWWVAHTRPRAEKVLAQHLTRLGILYYLPLRERITRSPNTDRLSRSMVPLFTGYLFFAATEEQRYRAMTTNRIVNTLAAPNQEQLVAELRHIHTVLLSGTAFTRRRGIQVGRWVRIVSGPLAGLDGIITQHRSRVRVVLNVHMLGQSVAVETTADAVEPIEPPRYTTE